MSGDRQSLDAIRFFNKAVRGEFTFVDPSKPQHPQFPPGLDARVPDLISEWDVLQNIRSSQPTRKLGSQSSVLANSDMMLGTVVVSVFFVESDGSGADSDVFDWTTAAEQETFAEVAAALSWWSARAADFTGCSVTFQLQAYYATEDARCAQWREPVLHASSEVHAAVSDVMSNYGYGVGDHLARVTAYNFDQRQSSAADWAYSAFLVANPTGSVSYTDNFAAWAYMGGPYVSLLQNSFNWSFRQVFAHESGHIFGACDEYHIPGFGGCTRCSECWTTGVDNANCEQCNTNSVSCMMRANTWSLCKFTPGQIGWWRSPCSTGSLGSPVLDSINPPLINQNSQSTMLFNGTHFNVGTTIDLGPDIQVTNVQRRSNDSLQADVQVSLDAATGPRSATLIGPDGQSTSSSAALEIVSTPLHYVSSLGSNEYPYTSPMTAGANLSTVLAAASIGDTVRIISGTYSSVVINKSMCIQGSWNAEFTLQLPEALPSVFESNGSGCAVGIYGASAQVTLDGLTLRNGRGTLLNVPGMGMIQSGGGLQCIDATVILRQCTIENNRSGSSVVPGVGGGVFVMNANATFKSCTVRNNHSGSGAGMFMVGSDVTLSDCQFVGNVRSGGTGLGVAMRALNSKVSMNGGILSSNMGGVSGGALYSENAVAVRLQDILIENNSVSSDGGGLWLDQSPLEMYSIRLVSNTSQMRGGGLYFTGGTLSIEGTLIANNRAVVFGGGVYANDVLPILDNVTVAQCSSAAASGVCLGQTRTGGRVRNSILYGQANGALLLASGMPVAVDWNQYWNNGAFDVSGGVGTHDQVIDPLFANPSSLDFQLLLHSPGIDTGSPDGPDLDGSLRDRGAFGGVYASSAAPDQPLGLAVRTANGKAIFSWHPSSSPLIDRYAIFRSNSSIPTLPLAISDLVGFVHAPTTQFIDPVIRSGDSYSVVAIDSNAYASGFAVPVTLAVTTDVGARDLGQVFLSPIFPNPTNPGSWIEFDVPKPASVKVVVYDARGKRVRLLQQSYGRLGHHRVFWDGRDSEGRESSSGVYWVRLQVASETYSRKLVLVR